LICENLQQLKRLEVNYVHGIRGLKALSKLENLEELILINTREEEGDEEMMNFQRYFHKILPKLKVFATNGLDNEDEFYEESHVDCKDITPCALETCYTTFENEDEA